MKGCGCEYLAEQCQKYTTATHIAAWMCELYMETFTGRGHTNATDKKGRQPDAAGRRVGPDLCDVGQIGNSSDVGCRLRIGLPCANRRLVAQLPILVLAPGEHLP